LSPFAEDAVDSDLERSESLGLMMLLFIEENVRDEAFLFDAIEFAVESMLFIMVSIVEAQDDEYGKL